MSELPMPQGFFWHLPAIRVPLRAIGAIIVDADGMTVANCPCSSYADAVAFTINQAMGVHAIMPPPLL